MWLQCQSPLITPEDADKPQLNLEEFQNQIKFL